MTDDDIIHRFEKLAAIQPADADTARAMERVRLALAQPITTPKRRVFGFGSRYLALAASVVIGLVAVGWFFWPTGSSGRVFGDVQDRIGQTKSVVVRLTEQEDDQPPESSKIMGLADGRVRIEQANGNYTIVDPKAEQSLAVDLQAKSALLIRGYFVRGPANIYRFLRDIGRDGVRQVGKEKIAGVDTEVFLSRMKTPDGEQEIKVWVESKSQLPVHVELTGPSGAKTKHTSRMDLAFDVIVDEKLFSLTPPAGFKLRIEGTSEPLKPTNDQAKLAPIVTPGVGIGDVKFGMSQKEVIEKLGQPDKIDRTSLDYSSRGYGILVSPQRGVVQIHCFSQASFAVKVKDFAGKTKEGIAMGASSADIIKAYGEPDSKEVEDGTTRLSYRKKLGLELTLFNDKLVDFVLWKTN
jgi:outer membrane lipoprotein-sorting protein